MNSYLEPWVNQSAALHPLTVICLKETDGMERLALEQSLKPGSASRGMALTFGSFLIRERGSAGHTESTGAQSACLDILSPAAWLWDLQGLLGRLSALVSHLPTWPQGPGLRCPGSSPHLRPGGIGVGRALGWDLHGLSSRRPGCLPVPPPPDSPSGFPGTTSQTSSSPGLFPAGIQGRTNSPLRNLGCERQKYPP